MNYIDIIILILVTFFCYKGFKRGLIKEMISLLSLIVGIYLASQFSFFLEDQLIKHFSRYKEIISSISFIIIFSIIYLSLKLAEIIISKISKTLYLGIINYPLGLVFGGLKTLLILSILMIEIEYLETKLNFKIPEEQKTQSLLYSPISNIIPTIMPIVNEKRNIIKPIEDKVDKTKEDLIKSTL